MNYATGLILRPSFSLRPWMSCSAISAYSMASISTLQVGGWVPLPPAHLVSPACTASSSFWGWALTHAFIVAASSSTPSRTALAFPAAFLLTCFLKSLRWSLRPVERTRPSHTHSPHVMSNHTHQSLPATTLQVLPVQVEVVQVPRLHRSGWGGDYVTHCYCDYTSTATSTHATQCPTSDLNTVSASSLPPPPHTYTVTQVGVCCLSHYTCYLLHDCRGWGWSDHRLSKLCDQDWNPSRLASIVTILQHLLEIFVGLHFSRKAYWTAKTFHPVKFQCIR